MKLFYTLFILIFLQNCSFDNKSGIWKNENTVSKKERDLFKDFETLNVSNQGFKNTIPIPKNFRFNKFALLDNKNWNDTLFDETNNLKNLRYK